MHFSVHLHAATPYPTVHSQVRPGRWCWQKVKYQFLRFILSVDFLTCELMDSIDSKVPLFCSIKWLNNFFGCTSLYICMPLHLNALCILRCVLVGHGGNKLTIIFWDSFFQLTSWLVSWCIVLGLHVTLLILSARWF